MVSNAASEPDRSEDDGAADAASGAQSSRAQGGESGAPVGGAHEGYGGSREPAQPLVDDPDAPGSSVADPDRDEAVEPDEPG